MMQRAVEAPLDPISFIILNFPNAAEVFVRQKHVFLSVSFGCDEQCDFSNS